MNSLLASADDAGYNVADNAASVSKVGVATDSTMLDPRLDESPPSIHVRFPSQEGSWSHAHAVEHLRSELKRVTADLQEQVDAVASTMSESRLSEQRARYRDRELIMQALQKQRDQNAAFTKQVVFTKTQNYSEEIKREECMLQKIQVRDA